MSYLLLHLREPVGWIALTLDALRNAQVAAQEMIGSDTNTSIDTTSTPTALLTAEAAAVVLSVDPQWLLRQAREARIPHYRIGRYVRFDPAAIAAYCAPFSPACYCYFCYFRYGIWAAHKGRREPGLIRSGSQDHPSSHLIPGSQTRLSRRVPDFRVAWGYYPLQKGSKGYLTRGEEIRTP